MRSMPSHINADAVYSNLTNMYNAKRRFDSALLYGQKRLDLNIMLKDNVGIARSYAGIIEIAANSGDKQLAQRIIRNITLLLILKQKRFTCSGQATLI